MADPKNAPNAPEVAPNRPEGAEAGGKKGKKEKKDKANREKKVRVKYPVPEGGLTEWPADFDPKKHKPLSRAAFKDETLWLERKADLAEKMAKKFRAEIEEIRTLGPGANRAKAKKLEKVQNELDALTQALKDSGVNVEELLAKQKAKQAS